MTFRKKGKVIQWSRGPIRVPSLLLCSCVTLGETSTLSGPKSVLCIIEWWQLDLFFFPRAMH